MRLLLIGGIASLLVLVTLFTLLTRQNASQSPPTVQNTNESPNGYVQNSQPNQKNNNRQQFNDTISVPDKSQSPTNYRQTNPRLTPTPTRSPVSLFSDSLNVLLPQLSNQNTIDSTPFKEDLSKINNPLNKKQETAVSPTPDPLLAFSRSLNILFNEHSDSYPQNAVTPLLSAPSSIPQLIDNQKASGNYQYYPQCNGPYDNSPLPNGCTICKAGCGPTTLAMILSSYLDKKIDPPAVAEMYKKNNLLAGCDGTRVGDAQIVLSNNNIKTTDLIYYGDSTSKEAIDDMKSYIENGWTLFMLAKFCPKGCGHFFWIVSIDDKNNVWSYDPGYGTKSIPPLNDNNLNPSPKYYVAIGVKRP